MTETQTQPTPPAFAFPSRVLSIPVVASSIDTIHTRLSTSPYTKSVYGTSQGIAVSAYGTAARVASATLFVQPVLSAADGVAIKGFDTLEKTFPYAFHSKPEDMLTDLKNEREKVRVATAKTIDQRIKAPVYGIATSVDQSLAPLVDLLEVLLTRLNVKDSHTDHASESSTASTSTASSDKAQLQVKRAKDLVLEAKDHFVALTAEQVNTLQNQNVYIQRAAEHARNVNNTIATSYQNVQAGFQVYKGKGVELSHDTQARIHALSQGLIAELEKIQEATVALPAHLQTKLEPVTSAIKSTAAELSEIVRSEGTTSEKTHKLATAIQGRVANLVEACKEVYAAALEKYGPAVRKKGEQVVNGATGDGHGPVTNGTH